MQLFHYYPPPTAFAEPSVTGFSQSSGPTTGGEEIIIHGNEFIKDETETVKDIYSFIDNTSFLISTASGRTFSFNAETKNLQEITEKLRSPIAKNLNKNFFTTESKKSFCINKENVTEITDKIGGSPIASSFYYVVLTEEGRLFQYEHQDFSDRCNLNFVEINSNLDGSPITDLAPGHNHVFALTSSGNAYFWDSSSWGDGPKTPTLLNTSLNVNEIIGENIIKASDNKHYLVSIDRITYDATIDEMEQTLGLNGPFQFSLAQSLGPNVLRFRTADNKTFAIFYDPYEQDHFELYPLPLDSAFDQLQGQLIIHQEGIYDIYGMAEDRLLLFDSGILANSSGEVLAHNTKEFFAHRETNNDLSIYYLTTENQLRSIRSSVYSLPPHSIVLPSSPTPQITAITFGETEITDFEILDANTIKLRVPAHASGHVTVTLTSKQGNIITVKDGYTYLGNPQTSDSYPAITLTLAIIATFYLVFNYHIAKRR